MKTPTLVQLVFSRRRVTELVNITRNQWMDLVWHPAKYFIVDLWNGEAYTINEFLEKYHGEEWKERGPSDSKP